MRGINSLLLLLVATGGPMAFIACWNPLDPLHSAGFANPDLYITTTGPPSDSIDLKHRLKAESTPPSNRAGCTDKIPQV